MKYLSLFFLLCVLMCVISLSCSASTTSKPTTKKPSSKPTTLKPNPKTTAKSKTVISTKTPTAKPKPTPTKKKVSVTAKPQTNVGTTAQTLNDCAFEKTCSSVVQRVWASDGKTCQPFQNECILFNFNCVRLYANEKVLSRVTEKDCKPLCKKTSKCEIQPNELICGVDNGNYKYFSNTCQMEASNCENGETYSETLSEYCEYLLE